jgi:cytochrome c553
MGKYRMIVAGLALAGTVGGVPAMAGALLPDAPGGLPVIAPGARLAATCSNCHGMDGRAQAPGMPALAGQTAQQLLATLLAFKSGQRPATVMGQLAKGYSDAQLAELANWFAKGE